MSKPCRPDLHFDSLDDLRADVDRLMSSEVVTSGQWPLAKILDHLNRWSVGFLDGGLPHLPRVVQPIARWFMRRMVRTQNYPSFPFIAPENIRPVDEPLDKAYTQFCQMVDRVRTLPATVKTIPVGDLQLEDFQGMVLLHAAHHLSFARSK